MPMTRRTAETIANTLRFADMEGRWTPCPLAEQLLITIETAVAVRIQAGQPKLEEMQDRIACLPAILLLAIATADMANGRIASPKAIEMHLLGEADAPSFDEGREEYGASVPMAAVIDIHPMQIEQLPLAA